MMNTEEWMLFVQLSDDLKKPTLFQNNSEMHEDLYVVTFLPLLMPNICVSNSKDLIEILCPITRVYILNL